jgi:hypothetical protein
LENRQKYEEFLTAKAKKAQKEGRIGACGIREA